MPAVGNPPQADIGSAGKQINQILIEADIWDDESPGIVPLFTKTKDLPPLPRGKKRTETIDRQRYNEYEASLEDQFFERIRLPKERQVIVRDHKALSVFQEMSAAIEKHKEPLIICGLDTEKDGATVQVSIELKDFYGEGKSFERNVLVQTRSKSGTDVFAEGRPTEFRKFIEHGRLVFTGKAIKGDIAKTASLLGIDVARRDEFKYIELDQLFDFCLHILRDYDSARNFLLADLGDPKERKKWWTVLKEISLKNLCRLPWETMTVQKLHEHRNHLNNCDEWRGPMSMDLQEYCSLDSRVNLAACYAIVELYGLSPFHFMRRYGSPAGELCTYAIICILEALADDKLHVLEPEGQQYAANLKAKLDGDLDLRFRRVVDSLRRWAGKRQLLIAELKMEREGKKYTFRKCEVSHATEVGRPLRPFRNVNPEENWGMEIADWDEPVSDTPPPPPVPAKVEASPAPSATFVSVGAMHDDDTDRNDGDDNDKSSDGRRSWRAPRSGLPETDEEISSGSEGIDVEDAAFVDADVFFYTYARCVPPDADSLTVEAAPPSLPLASSSPSPPSSSPPVAPPSLPTPSSSSSSVPTPSSTASIVSFSTPLSSSSSSPMFKSPKSPSTRSDSRSTPVRLSSLRAPSMPPVNRVVDKLIKARDHDFPAILSAHLPKDVEKAAEFCFKILVAMAKQIREASWRNKLIGSFTLALSGRVLSRLVDRVLRDNAFGKGRVHAIARMGFYLVHSAILYDFFFNSTDQLDFTTLVRSYGKAEVLERVKFLLETFAKPEEFHAKVKEYSFFSTVSLDHVKKTVTPKKVKKFAIIVCREAGIELPRESHRIDLLLFLDPAIRQYIDQKTEPRDFFVAFRDMTQGDADLEEFALKSIAAKCPALAVYVSERGSLSASSASSSDEMTPECEKPFNKKLHDMCSPKDFMVSESRLAEFERCLESSSYFCMDFHVVTRSSGSKGPIGLVTFRFRSVSAFVMPNLFPNTITPIANLLRRHPRPVVTYRWDRFKKACSELLKWEPTAVHTANEVAGIAHSPPLDLIAESVTGGKFCGRGGGFHDTAIPSTVALRHKSMRAAIVYEYIVEGKGLRRRDPVGSDVRVVVDTRHARTKRERSNERGCSSRDFYGKRVRYGNHHDRR